MTLCIFGSGAIGSEIGGKLARAGETVTLVGRGAHLAAMHERGLTLVENGATRATVPVHTTDDPVTLPKQDVVVVTIKAQAIPAAASQIAALLHEGSRVVFALNGIPWWYFYRHGGRLDNVQLRSLDPDGIIWETIPLAQVMGCVVHLASTISAPGTVNYVKNEQTTLCLGEPDRTISEDCTQLAGVLTRSGTPTEVMADIRSEIWYKLWGNAAFNPVTALTHATMDALVECYHDTDLLEVIMNEVRFVAEKSGVVLLKGMEERLATAASMKGHKTSMLQDIEQGRPTEVEAIIGAAREIGRLIGADTPYLNCLYSLICLKEQFYRR